MPETVSAVAVVISAAAVLITGLFGVWRMIANLEDRLVKRLDGVDAGLRHEIAASEARVNVRIDRLDIDLRREIAAVETRVNDRIGRVEAGLNLVADRLGSLEQRVARLEPQAPPPAATEISLNERGA